MVCHRMMIFFSLRWRRDLQKTLRFVHSYNSFTYKTGKLNAEFSKLTAKASVSRVTTVLCPDRM